MRNGNKFSKIPVPIFIMFTICFWGCTGGSEPTNSIGSKNGTKSKSENISKSSSDEVKDPKTYNEKLDEWKTLDASELGEALANEKEPIKQALADLKDKIEKFDNEELLDFTSRLPEDWRENVVDKFLTKEKLANLESLIALAFIRGVPKKGKEIFDGVIDSAKFKESFKLEYASNSDDIRSFLLSQAYNAKGLEGIIAVIEKDIVPKDDLLKATPLFNFPQLKTSTLLYSALFIQSLVSLPRNNNNYEEIAHQLDDVIRSPKYYTVALIDPNGIKKLGHAFKDKLGEEKFKLLCNNNTNASTSNQTVLTLISKTSGKNPEKNSPKLSEEDAAILLGCFEFAF